MPNQQQREGRQRANEAQRRMPERARRGRRRRGDGREQVAGDVADGRPRRARSGRRRRRGAGRRGRVGGRRVNGVGRRRRAEGLVLQAGPTQRPEVRSGSARRGLRDCAGASAADGGPASRAHGTPCRTQASRLTRTSDSKGPRALQPASHAPSSAQGRRAVTPRLTVQVKSWPVRHRRSMLTLRGMCASTRAAAGVGVRRVVRAHGAKAVHKGQLQGH